MTVELIRSTNDGIRYFASNMLYTKVRKHWTQLSDVQKKDLYNVVGELLGSCDHAMTNMTKIYVNRLILTYFSICCHIPDGLKHYLSIAASVISSNISASTTDCDGAIASANKVMIGCSMLAIVPNEIEVLDVSSDCRDELKACCMLLEEALLANTVLPLAQLLSSRLGAVAKAADADTLGGLLACYSQVLKILHGWCPLLGLSLTKLYKTYPAFYNVILFAFQIAKHVMLGSNVCKYDNGGRGPLLQKVGLMVNDALLLVKEIIGVNEYPVDDATRQLVVDQALVKCIFIDNWDLLCCLVHMEPGDLLHLQDMVACFSNLRSCGGEVVILLADTADRTIFRMLYTEDTAFAVTECLSCLLSSEIHHFSAQVLEINSYTKDVSTATVLADHMRMFFMAVFCTMQKPRKLALGVFDVWASLQDMPMAHRQSSLRADIYGLVVLVVIDQLSYPPRLGQTENGDDEWSEDRLELRDWDNGIQDLMILSYYALGNQAFFSLLSHLMWKPGAEWNKVEVVLSVIDMVTAVATDNDGEATFTDNQLEVLPYFAQISGGILQVLQQLEARSQPYIEYKLLLTAICRYITSMGSFMFKYEAPAGANTPIFDSLTGLRKVILNSFVQALFHHLESASSKELQLLVVKTVLKVVTRGGNCYAELDLQVIIEMTHGLLMNKLMDIHNSYRISGAAPVGAESCISASLVGVLVTLCHSLGAITVLGTSTPSHTIIIDSVLQKCVEILLVATSSFEKSSLSKANADQLNRLDSIYEVALCISQAFLTLPKAFGECNYLMHLFESSAVVQYLNHMDSLCSDLLHCSDSNCSVNVKACVAGICNSLALIYEKYSDLLLKHLRATDSDRYPIGLIVERYIHISNVCVAFGKSELIIPAALTCLQIVIIGLSQALKNKAISSEQKLTLTSCLISSIGINILDSMISNCYCRSYSSSMLSSSCQLLSVLLVECSDILWTHNSSNVVVDTGGTLGECCTLVITKIPVLLLAILTVRGTNSGDNAYPLCKNNFGAIIHLFYPTSIDHSACENSGLTSMIYHSFWIHNMLEIQSSDQQPQSCMGSQIIQVLIKLLCGTLTVTDMGNSKSLILTSTCWPLLSDALFWIIKGCSVSFSAEMEENLTAMQLSSGPSLMPVAWYQDMSSRCRYYIGSAFASEKDDSTINGVNLIPLEIRNRLVQCLFDLCLETNNRRKFKMIMLDILKVCYGECSVDCLLSHVD